jgi:hypothetical protein
MTEESQRWRNRIRSYEICPCSHGVHCQCSQRLDWEGAVERVYELERREEALTEMVRLSEEAGLYD